MDDRSFDHDPTITFPQSIYGPSGTHLGYTYLHEQKEEEEEKDESTHVGRCGRHVENGRTSSLRAPRRKEQEIETVSLLTCSPYGLWTTRHVVCLLCGRLLLVSQFFPSKQLVHNPQGQFIERQYSNEEKSFTRFGCGCC